MENISHESLNNSYSLLPHNDIYQKNGDAGLQVIRTENRNPVR